MQWQFKDYWIDTDIGKLDIERIHRFLDKESSWANGISKQLVEKSIQNSLNFGLYNKDSMIGFARIITDRATFANMVDVFIEPELQGKGLSHYLMRAIDEHPDLQGIRRFTLATSTAKFLYKKYGFTELNNPSTMMERYIPNIYREKNDSSN